MMMERSDPEYLFSLSELLGGELNNDRTDFQDIDS